MAYRKPNFEKLRSAFVRDFGVPTSEIMGPYNLAAWLLLHYFGKHWFDSHVMPTRSKKGFLRTGPQTNRDEDIHMWRLIELAELLYNCEPYPGFEDLVKRSSSEREIEAVVAELRVARLLVMSEIPFEFVTPNKVKGESYDLRLRIAEGLWCPADTKAKVEGGDLSDATIRNSLEAARKQLPKGAAGIVFLHLPQEWAAGTREVAPIDDGWPKQLDELSAAFDRAIPAFLRSTSRVLAVCMVFQPMHQVHRSAYVVHTLLIKEFVNPSHQSASQYPKSGLFREGGRNWVCLYEEGSPARYRDTAARMAL